MKLVDNWRSWWKMWTIRINIIIGLLIAIFSQFPDTFLHLWVLVPTEWQQQILTVDGLGTIIMGILVLSSIARVVKQDVLHIKKEEDSQDKKEE